MRETPNIKGATHSLTPQRVKAALDFADRAKDGTISFGGLPFQHRTVAEIDAAQRRAADVEVGKSKADWSVERMLKRDAIQGSRKLAQALARFYENRELSMKLPVVDKPAPASDRPSSPVQALINGPNWMERRRDLLARAEQFLSARGFGVRIRDRQEPVRRYYVGSIRQPMMLEDVIDFAIDKGMEIDG